MNRFGRLQVNTASTDIACHISINIISLPISCIPSRFRSIYVVIVIVIAIAIWMITAQRARAHDYKNMLSIELRVPNTRQSVFRLSCNINKRNSFELCLVYRRRFRISVIRLHQQQTTKDSRHSHHHPPHTHQRVNACGVPHVLCISSSIRVPIGWNAHV